MISHEARRLDRARRIADRLAALGASAEFAASLTADQRHGAALMSGAAEDYQPAVETWALMLDMLREREALARLTPAEILASA